MCTCTMYGHPLNAIPRNDVLPDLSRERKLCLHEFLADLTLDLFFILVR